MFKFSAPPPSPTREDSLLPTAEPLLLRCQSRFSCKVGLGASFIKSSIRSLGHVSPSPPPPDDFTKSPFQQTQLRFGISWYDCSPLFNTQSHHRKDSNSVNILTLISTFLMHNFQPISKPHTRLTGQRKRRTTQN